MMMKFVVEIDKTDGYNDSLDPEKMQKNKKRIDS